MAIAETSVTFRSKKLHGLSGAVGFLFITALSLVNLYSTLFRRGPEPPSLVGALMWILGIWILLGGSGLYLLAFLLRHKLVVQEGRVRSTNVFTSWEIELSEIDSAFWGKLAANGSLVVRANGKNRLIVFRHYEPVEIRALAGLFREAIPFDRQIGWDLFAQRIAMGDPAKGTPQPGKGEILITRRRYDRLFLAGVAGLAVVGIAGWFFTRDLRFAAAPVQIGMIWLLCRLMCPKQGFTDRVMTRLERHLICFAVSWSFVGLIVLRVFALDEGESSNSPWGWIGLGVWLLVGIVETATLHFRRRREERIPPIQGVIPGAELESLAGER